jgi:hypothetical protein
LIVPRVVEDPVPVLCHQEVAGQEVPVKIGGEIDLELLLMERLVMMRLEGHRLFMEQRILSRIGGFMWAICPMRLNGLL